MQVHKLSSNYQSAYRRGFSTETALLKLSSDILGKTNGYSSSPLLYTPLITIYSAKCYRLLLGCPIQRWILSLRMVEEDLEFSVPQGSLWVCSFYCLC